VGHSGVGKSTLVNALAPTAMRATGHVNAVTGRGRQTSTSVRAIALEDGWIIDTPGVRSFGLGHIKAENLLRSFEDLYAIIETCPRDCNHTADAPDCALDDAIADAKLGDSGVARVDSLRRIMKSLDGAGENETRPPRGTA
jgi:ribosome biogenesis GTPase